MLGVKMLRYEGDWWECCRHEKVTEMRLAVTGVLAVRIKCRLGGLSRSETGMMNCSIRPKAAFLVGKNIFMKLVKPLDYLVIISYTVFTIKSCKIYMKSCGISRIVFLIFSIYFTYLAISFYSRISFV